MNLTEHVLLSSYIKNTCTACEFEKNCSKSTVQIKICISEETDETMGKRRKVKNKKQLNNKIDSSIKTLAKKTIKLLIAGKKANNTSAAALFSNNLTELKQQFEQIGLC